MLGSVLKVLCRVTRATLLSTFVTDPSITPNPIPARGEAERARDDRLDDRLDEAAYLRDEAGPAS